MATCHPPRRLTAPSGWLLTDARLAGHGRNAAQHIPPGSGIIVRSDNLACAERVKLIRHMRRIAAARGHVLLLAGVTPDRAQRLGAAGVHLRDRSGGRAAQAKRLGLISSAPVHNRREAQATRRARIDYALISPLYATRSHADAQPITVRRFAQLARHASARPIALGGMTAARYRDLCRRYNKYSLRPGWAAIDAWESC